MLVLSRKKNESIVINENIVVTVVEIRGDKARLGIEAPREIPVDRFEVHYAKMKGRELRESELRAAEKGLVDVLEIELERAEQGQPE